MRGSKVISSAVLAIGISLTAAICDREALLSSVSDYLVAQDTGLAGSLRNVAHDFEYIENNKSKEITEGTIFKGQRLVYNRTIVDMTACATATEIIGSQQTNDASPYLIVFQMHHNPDDNTSLALLDTTITTTGNWNFNVSGSLRYAAQEDWSIIEDPDDRVPRESLLAGADVYLDAYGNRSSTAAGSLAFGCQALEQSVRTTCAKNLSSGGAGNSSSSSTGDSGNNETALMVPVSSRRYVVDEERGAVSVLGISGPLHAPSSFEFRIERGRLRYVDIVVAIKASDVK